MRIVIDMQGAQSNGSWNRGIGRYTMSLALAIVRNREANEVILAINGAFPDSIERIRNKFEGLLPQENIRLWDGQTSVAFTEHAGVWRRQAGELVREAFLASLRPDVILVSSLFEGLSDDAVTSVKRFASDHLVSVILYDLIPFIHRQPYLENPVVESWYLEKIEYLRRADLWLGISKSSSREGVEYLKLPPERCVSISTDADAQFKNLDVSAEAERLLREKYRLTRSFVMYTGGIDHRKNIERLMRAYAKLKPSLRIQYQLAIVCSVQEDSRLRLLRLASDIGLNPDELVLTGFVPEEDLVAFYNLSSLFVFPSLHEGFGLPVLEAMRCSVPVIAANTSSLPEVVGLEDALFDPNSEESIRCAIERALCDKEFRAQLIAHAQKQALNFSWDKTAQRAIEAMGHLLLEKKSNQTHRGQTKKRLKLACVSPLPPERSGISDYTAELLPALAQHYDIEVIVAQDKVIDPWIQANCPIRSVEWFVEHSEQFDRVLYHFGNSAFHQHMFGLLKKIPGVVVLHDFYLSGVLHYMDALGYAPGCFNNQLYLSHGYAALYDLSQAKDVAEIIWKYPCGMDVIADSIGTIVHSENSARLAQTWFRQDRHKLSVIPLMRVEARGGNSSDARKCLGFSENDFVICSFGMLGPTKLNHRLLSAWLNSDLVKSDACYLIFVGENQPGDYGNDLLSAIKQHPNGGSIRITGWTDPDTYKNYLSIADVAVQLRTLSRGETSAGVLDCMNYGVPTIVNSNGSMAELDDHAVWKLSDEFDDVALINALETLWRSHERRKQIGANAKKILSEDHNSRRCAEQYNLSIEAFYENNSRPLRNLFKLIVDAPSEPECDSDVVSIANSIARTFPPPVGIKTLLVDVSELIESKANTLVNDVVRAILRHWLLNPPTGWRVEPVYATTIKPYRYARRFTTSFLGMPKSDLKDEPIDFSSGDAFFALGYFPKIQVNQATFYQTLRKHGVSIKFMCFDVENVSQDLDNCVKDWLQVVVENDGVICNSEEFANRLQKLLASIEHRQLAYPKIGVCHLRVGINYPHQAQGDLRIEGGTQEQVFKERAEQLLAELNVGN